MKFYVVGILGCLAVAACVPAIPIPMPTPKAPPRTATEVVASAVTPRDGAGAIVLSRDNRVWGKGCTYEISVDDQVVAALRTGEQVTIYADPGRRILGISIRSEGSCEPALAQVPLQVVANATTRIKVGADASHALRVEATTY